MEEQVIEGLDLSAVKEEYAGKWVALSKDYRTVFASADSLQSLLKKSDIPEQVVIIANCGWAGAIKTGSFD